MSVVDSVPPRFPFVPSCSARHVYPLVPHGGSLESLALVQKSQGTGNCMAKSTSLYGDE